jgi:hypothetical protein
VIVVHSMHQMTSDSSSEYPLSHSSRNSPSTVKVIITTIEDSNANSNLNDDRVMMMVFRGCF